MIKRFLNQNIGIFIGVALLTGGIVVVNTITDGSLVRLMSGIANNETDLFLGSAKLKTKTDEDSAEIQLHSDQNLGRYVLKQERQDVSRYMFGGIFAKEDEGAKGTGNPLAGTENKCPAEFQEVDSNELEDVTAMIDNKSSLYYCKSDNNLTPDALRGTVDP